MSIIGTDEDQEGIDPQQQSHGAGIYSPAAQAPGSVASSSGGSGFVGGGSGQGATSTPSGGTSSPAPTSSGSGYTNLLSYVGANQGAGQTMGNAAQNVAQNTGKQAASDLNNYAELGSQDAANKTVNVDPTVMNQINNGMTGGAKTATKNADGSTTFNTSATNYGGPTPSVSYTGPTGSTNQTFANTQAAQNSGYGDLARLAGMNTQATGGSAGTAALLGDLYSQPGYTPGQQSFDSAILGGTSGGQAGLAGVTAANTNAINAGQTADAAVNTADANAASTTAATQAAYNAAIAGMKAKASGSTSITSPGNVGGGPLVNQFAQPATTTANKGSGLSQVANAASHAGGPVESGPLLQQIAGSASAPGNATAGANAGAPITSNDASTGQNIINTVTNSAPVQTAVNTVHKYLAGGGEVGDDDDTAPLDLGPGFNFGVGGGSGGSGGGMGSLMKLAPLAMMALGKGGPVPGKPPIPGKNDLRNDKVPAMLTSEEVVLPLTVTKAKDAPKKAEQFMRDIQKNEKHRHPYAGLMKMAGGRS